jgi:hypothetical protein
LSCRNTASSGARPRLAAALAADLHRPCRPHARLRGHRTGSGVPHCFPRGEGCTERRAYRCGAGSGYDGGERPDDVPAVRGTVRGDAEGLCRQPGMGLDCRAVTAACCSCLDAIEAHVEFATVCAPCVLYRSERSTSYTLSARIRPPTFHALDPPSPERVAVAANESGWLGSRVCATVAIQALPSRRGRQSQMTWPGAGHSFWSLMLRPACALS